MSGVISCCNSNCWPPAVAFFGEPDQLQQGEPVAVATTWLAGKDGHQLMWDLGDDAELDVYTAPPGYSGYHPFCDWTLLGDRLSRP